MNRRHLILLGAGAMAMPSRAATNLKVGDAAPDFSLRSTKNSTVKLSELRGKTVVLAFFPAAFTGG